MNSKSIKSSAPAGGAGQPNIGGIIKKFK